MRLTPRPAGSTLTWPTNVKVKAINQVHKSTDIDGYNWPLMWDSHYDWSGWLQPGLDKVAALGANTVKIIGLGAQALDTGGTTFKPYLADRVRRYLAYATSLGLMIYWQVNTRPAYGTTSQLVAAAVANATLLAPYNVVGMDLWNEANTEGTTQQFVDFMSQAYPQIKAVAPIPLTISAVDYPPPTSGTDGYKTMNRLAPYVDFWDFHPYQKTSGQAYPAAADLAAFRADPLYKPYLIGESGAPRTNNGWPFGAAQQDTMWVRLGMMAQEPDCLGVVGFSLTDYDAYQFGVFDETLVAPKTECSGPFTGWRDVR